MTKSLSRALAIVLMAAMLMLNLSGCAGSENTESYRSDSITSKLSIAEDVQKYYDAVDTEYGYDLAYKLAYDKQYWDNELGWRTAGSDAEHRCADYLADEMKRIGLSEVEKVAVDCDRFQLNSTSLTLKGTDLKLAPGAYQCSGTNGDLTAELVDCGTGFEADYEGLDVRGKIALVGVNQMDEAWINHYINQAYEKGAAALVTYSVGGYGQANDDTINVQDVCCSDLIPTVAISRNQGEELVREIRSGNNMATLNVDADLETGGGTTYNIMGKLPGKSHDQQIIVSGHYDKYWYGFQDDCAAIGLVYSVAKAMIDSGIEPENDILFVAHGAEEWGVSGSCFDWTMGAWGMIEKNSQWQGTTLAMLNCELPAFALESNALEIGCVPEFRTIVSNMISKYGLLVTSGEVGIRRRSFDSSNMEDGVSYRWHGVPYFINGVVNEASFIADKYHTVEDNADTYDEDSFRTNINWYGAMAMYIDSMPALELDLTQSAKDLAGNLSEDIDGEAGVDLDAYRAATDEMTDKAEGLNRQIADINEAYEKAIARGDEKEAAALRAEGKEINRKTLNAFGEIQDAFCKVDDFAVYYGHPNMTLNVQYLDGVLAGLDKGVLWGEDEKGALDYALRINGAHDYTYIRFSKDVGDKCNSNYDPEVMDPAKTLWGYNRSIEVIHVGDATYELKQLEELDELGDAELERYKSIYRAGRVAALRCIANYAAGEIRDIRRITEQL